MGKKIAVVLTMVDIGAELFSTFVEPWLKSRTRRFIRDRYKPAIRLNNFNKIPENKKSRVGKLYIQRHEALHLHHDISIVDADGIEIFRGAVSKGEIERLFPQGDVVRTSFARQPQHSKGKYGYNWSGIIQEGYGRGTQTVVFNEDIELLKTHSKGEILFNIYKTDTNRSITGRFALIDPKDSKGNWICSRRKYDEPQIKGKNKFKLIAGTTGRDVPPKAFDLEKKLKENNQAYIIEAKIDGAANLIRFDKSGNQIYSWREGKRESTIFLQDKFPDIRDDIHSEFHGTIARGELIYVPGRRITRGQVFKDYGFEHPHLLAKFSLISNPLRSRSEQQIQKGQSAIVIYDLAKVNGRSAKSLTYREKHKIMAKIADNHTYVYVPEQFDSVRNGWKAVVEKRRGEGLVIKLLDEVTPDPQFNPEAQAWWKIKKTDFYDCKIVGWEPLETKSSKIDKTRIGALHCKIDGLGNTDVGSGFTDYERKWFAKNIDEVINNDSIIKIKGHHITDSGSIHGPVFDSVHFEKSEGPILELLGEQ
ncbi:MAG TPA: hypothetical protein VI911_10810 [Patescibacteria group bacterium]|nr:hypothetical protein [Patescibacteria group bacterium]